MKPKNHNDAVIIICSTPYSRRIPEKCFKEIAGKTILAHILGRIAPLEMPTILAIPRMPKDSIYYDAYQQHAKYFNVKLFSGFIASPLHRMASAIRKHCKNVKYVIRITHDDIIIDAETIDLLLEKMRSTGASYGYTPDIIEGAGVEIILAKTILDRADSTKDPVEHISYFVKGQNPIKCKPRLSICRPYRLTLDYPEDVIVMATIMRAIGSEASCDKICRYIDENILLLRYNALPVVTIYTCMFNAEKWICDCITSIQLAAKTTRVNIEYILVDDLSTDSGLTKAIQQLAIWDIKNYKVIMNDKNIGLAASSNIALDLARGKYIMRVDADDMISPCAIKNLIDLMKKTSATIIYPAYQEFSDELPERRTIPPSKYHHAGGALMNKKTINELKFREDLRHWDSLDLYSRIRRRPELSIVYYYEPTFYYRLHKGSMSAKKTKARIDTFDKIIKRYGVKE